MKVALKFCGLDPEVYTAHSFRIGAASHALRTGHSNTQIQETGSWQSDAFRKYISLEKGQVSSPGPMRADSHAAARMGKPVLRACGGLPPLCCWGTISRMFRDFLAAEQIHDRVEN